MKAIASNGVEIKTGDEVLVRNNYKETWKYSFFSHKEANSYVTSGFHYLYCIPYKENECLVGTTGDFGTPKNKVPTYTERQEQWIKKYNIKVEEKFEFKFGAKVKAWNNYISAGQIGILIGQDLKDINERYYVAFSTNDEEGGDAIWFSNIEYLE